MVFNGKCYLVRGAPSKAFCSFVLAMSDHVSKLTTDLLIHELKDVTGWEYMGFYLGFGMADIKEIEQDHPDTARRRMEMLDRWMRKEVSPSWEMVIEALEKMSELRLAHQLREKYCTQQHKDEKPPTSTSEDQTDSQEIERVLKVDRNNIVAQQIEDFEDRYLVIVRNTEAVIKSGNPPGRDIEWFSDYYMSKEVTKVEELFDQLKPLDYLNCTMLEKIIKYFLKQDQLVVAEFNDYIQDLKKFKLSTSVQEFMESIEAAQRPLSETERPGTITVKLRLVGGWLTKTVNDLDKLLKVLFEDKSSVLSHIKIELGSVIITYLAPQTEVDSLITIVAGKISFMIQVGICELQIGDAVVTSTQSETSDLSFESFLIKSVLNNNINALNFLLDISTSPDAADGEGRTPLMFASQLGNSKAVSGLLKASANPNVPLRQNGATSLLFASLDGHSSIVGMLLNANANPNLQTVDGITPLFAASCRGHSDIVRLLLKANANPNLHTDNGATPLHLASGCGHSDIISLLLTANANPNSQDKIGVTPLYEASMNGHYDAVNLLLKANANPNLHLDNGATPLHTASYYGHSEIISLLLTANANPNSQDINGVTPLYAASMDGHYDAVNLLLKASADPNLHAHDGTTPLYDASGHGYFDIVSLLVKANANPNILADEGKTPLHVASMNGHCNVVNSLLEAGADSNLHTKEVRTPLMYACIKCHSQVVQLLMTSGADPNLQMAKGGITALMCACQVGCFESVELLLASGADPNLRSHDGVTALDLAACEGHDDIVDLIQTFELSHSSSTSPVLTATEVATNVDNEVLASLYKAMEKLLVEKTESFISAQYHKIEKVLPHKHEQELQ